MLYNVVLTFELAVDELVMYANQIKATLQHFSVSSMGHEGISAFFQNLVHFFALRFFI